MTDVRLTHPLYAGDTLYAESVCTALRPSASRPYAGIVSMTTRGLNQDGDEIISFRRSVMVATRASGIGQGYFPEAMTGPLVAAPAVQGAGR
jgi:acyl dehydratase